MISRPSPNFDNRPGPGRVKYLILHYTGMATGREALERLCDPASRVSAHYLIEEDGRIFSLVAEQKRAWHAGESSWEGDQDINGLSLGIELVNPGHDGPDYVGNYRPFPPEQMRSLIALCQDILSRHEIKPWHILAHSDVAPARKCDPGELFDWTGLAQAGIGLWPEKYIEQHIAQHILAEDGTDVAVFQQKLAEYGYGIMLDGVPDSRTRAVVCAFQRHFRSAKIDGIMDGESSAVLDNLLKCRKIIDPA